MVCKRKKIKKNLKKKNFKKFENEKRERWLPNSALAEKKATTSDFFNKSCATLLNGVYEQLLSNYLVVAWVQKSPRVGAVNIAPRDGNKHTSTIRLPFKEQRNGVKPAAKAPVRVLLMILNRLKTHVFRKI